MTAERPRSGLGLPPALRLRKSRDYRRVQRRGRRVRQAHLLACIQAGPGPGPRVGITVSRKVGGAVVRNRVKRWLREAIRHEAHRLPDGWDVVLIAHPSAANAGALVLCQQVSKVFDTVGRPPTSAGHTGQRRGRAARGEAR